ncbi:hypothetical protein DWW47_18685 [Odoribacter splanchnicus]|jgi:hypothetical protein|nr:hypothetical protein DWW47_18685 [Odoribacter splanchnicus]RHA75958.1 hypothetical protein DW919_12730 [Odoribacter splanchnicus]RHL75218.1 hypothetical protein DWZ99_20075 [Odoribacter splanchnicus]
MAFIFYSQFFARFLFVFIFLAEGDSLKSLLITASNIMKIFQTFPDISTGIGRWHQSDNKHIGLSTATAGYYQTTINQGAFMDKIVKMTARSVPEYPKKKVPKDFNLPALFLRNRLIYSRSL